MAIEAKDISTFLLNIPKDMREYLVENISPYTLRRWFGQIKNGVLKDKRELQKKIQDIMDGKEELSNLAKFEKTLE